MKQVIATILSVIIISGCEGTADSVFRPDFGQESASQPSGTNYSPPSAAARAQAARDAAPTARDPQTAAQPGKLSLPNAPSLPKPANSSDTYQKPLPARTRQASPSTPSSASGGVLPYYQQQLLLQQGNSVPGGAPPKPQPIERSWIDSLFGDDEPPQSAMAPNCYTGRLTNEGDTCQALRTNDGRLLTLAGPLRGFGVGDNVCVCGPVAETAFCQQGTTIYVAEIDLRCANP
ncbi:MAG: DUF5818 domain-containing protein [Alphaproteobacteria bacterium]|jgi:hypothetical protein